MKRKAIPLLLSLIVLSLTNCQSQKNSQIGLNDYKQNSNVLYQSNVITKSGQENYFVVYRCSNKYIPIKIANSVLWEGLVKGEYVIIEFHGAVKSVEFVKLNWDGKRLEEVGLINSLQNSEDKIIIMPSATLSA